MGGLVDFAADEHSGISWLIVVLNPHAERYRFALFIDAIDACVQLRNHLIEHANLDLRVYGSCPIAVIPIAVIGSRRSRPLSRRDTRAAHAG